MEVIAKIDGLNTSDGGLNLLITDSEGNISNVKCDYSYKEILKVGHIYKFEINKIFNKNVVDKVTIMDDLECDEIVNIMNSFTQTTPLKYNEAKSIIDSYVNEIDSEIIKNIVKHILNKNEKNFYTYPAATKMHHAYVGGLAYHTYGMLNMANSFLNNYKYLSKDYLYAGIILHDIGKTEEFSGMQNPEYSLKGQLLGHLVIGGIDVYEAAKELGYEESEEVLILAHMLISHHGQPQFGACKKPMTAEALVLWYIDTIDSKFRALGEELEKTNVGEYTDVIGVLDRSKIYKHK